MTTVFRCDRLPLGSVTRTDEGFIVANAPIAKIGVMSYALADGTTRRELVDQETLTNVDSNESLKLKPVTNTHPREIIVNKRNSKFRTVGSVGETINFKNDALFAKFTINNQDAITDVENGRKQLSPGYKVDIVMEPGVFEGQRYDAVQRNRRYNHLAVVDSARGGSELKLNIDHCDSDDGIQFINNNKESIRMGTFRIDGIEYDAAPEVVNHISKLSAKIDGLNDDIKTAEANASKHEAKADSLSEEVEELKKVDSQDKVRAAVKERLGLEKVASRVLKEDSFDALTNVELMKKVIVSKYPDSEKKLDGKDEVYVSARFDAITETLDKDAFAKQKKIVNNQDGGIKEEDKIDSFTARQNMIKDMNNAYKREVV
jgi:hypothetical protein